MEISKKDEIYMGAALEMARQCFESDDVPVGAVIVRHGEIIARGRNRREQLGDATCHAEIEAVREACRALGGWHLTDCEMYVTLEPCPMCAGAISNARIDRVVVGTTEPKGGALGSCFNLYSFPINHKPQTEIGVLRDECAAELKRFFAEKRLRGKRR